MSEVNYCYSRDEEFFRSDDIGELIEEIRCDVDEDDLVGTTYWKGEKHDVKADNYIHVESILEQIDEWIYEDIGEIYDCDFASVSKEAKDELKAAIVEWPKKHVNLNYWHVLNVEECKLTEEDLE